MVKKMYTMLLLMTFILISFILTGCRTEENLGQFWELKEAYHQKLLDDNDIKEIAFYHNNNISLNTLDEKAEKQIINSRYFEMAAEIYPDGSKRYPRFAQDEIKIVKYYGVYHSYFIVMLEDVYDSFLEVEEDEMIGHTIFNYVNSNRIKVWVEKKQLK